MTAPGPTGPAPSASRWADLGPRIGSALVMVVLALGTALLGGQPFALFWLAVAVAVVWEWQRLIGPDGARARALSGAAGLAVAVPLASAGLPGVAAGAIVAGAAGAAALGPGRRGLAALGVGYGGALAISVVLLRDSVAGTIGLVAILWLFAVVWGTDVVAYFAGRLIGGPKLSPRWSPKKTWSGLLAGVAAGALLGVAVAPAEANRLAVLLVGCCAGLVAQAGDVAESALKRRFGAKDASRLIPGHGGVMDRVDGFLAASVFAFGLGAGRAGVDAAALGLFNW